MKKHPDYVEGYGGSINELAELISNMQYDKMALFIKYLADDLTRQAESDLGRKRSRPNLASMLYLTADELDTAASKMSSVANIYQEYVHSTQDDSIDVINRSSSIEGYSGIMTELAKSVGNMTYNKTAFFIDSLANNICEFVMDSEEFTEEFTIKLSATVIALYNAASDMNSAWNKICKHYMQE